MTRARSLASVLACFLVLFGASSASAAPPDPLPIKMPSPSLVRGFYQIADSQPGGMPAAMHAAIYRGLHKGFPSQAVCLRKLKTGCWLLTDSLWTNYRLKKYPNRFKFRDGGFAMELYFATNDKRGYGSVREKLHQLYASGALPGEIPNRPIHFNSIGEAVNWTIKYYKFLSPRMERMRKAQLSARSHALERKPSTKRAVKNR